MNGTIDIFMEVLRAALKREQPVLEAVTAQQWGEVFALARIHKVLPLIYETVYALPALAGEQALLAAMKREVRRQVITQAVKTGEFLQLNDRLQQAGVQPLVVKGIVCRSLYPRPDHRPSGDEDVLIPPEQFETCHQVLMDFGMATAEPMEILQETDEVPYRKEGSPLYIELHKHLFPPQSDAYGDMNRFFEHVDQRAVTLQFQEHRILTLDYTDHLFYLICHALKHFLHSGFGIRQVCDIILYANAWGSRVDWLRILENCRAIRAEKFAAAIFRIGSEHLVFDPEKAAWPEAWRAIEVDEMPMLLDLLAGGLYGDSTMSRKHSSNITLDAMAAQKVGKRAKSGLVSSAFPPAKKLEGRYPYLKKHRYLLPVAWITRILTYAKETQSSKDNNASDALKIGGERVTLMRTYGILE